MRIIVTGGSGFIASHLIKYLLEHYDKIGILSIDNYLSGTIQNEVKDPRISYIEDTSSNIFRYSGFSPQYVFHFGEYSRIGQSFYAMMRQERSRL